MRYSLGIKNAIYPRKYSRVEMKENSHQTKQRRKEKANKNCISIEKANKIVAKPAFLSHLTQNSSPQSSPIYPFIQTRHEHSFRLLKFVNLLEHSPFLIYVFFPAICWQIFFFKFSQVPCWCFYFISVFVGKLFTEEKTREPLSSSLFL